MFTVGLPEWEDEEHEEYAWQVQPYECSEGPPQILGDNPTHINTQIEHRPRHDTNETKPIIEFLLRDELILLELRVHDRQDDMPAPNDKRADLIEYCEYDQ